MASASDSARSRDDAEAKAQAVYAAASAYVAAEMLSGKEPGREVDPSSPVVRSGITLAIALIRSTPSRYGSDIPRAVVNQNLEDRAASLGKEIADKAVREAREHLRTVADRMPDATTREIADAYTADTPWQKAAARTLATRQAAETALSMVEDVNREVGENHRIVWISRGDRRVRHSHRRLHGKVRKPGTAFKSWPTTGQRLSFPGDPRAPLNETINCRCALILVPESSSHVVPDTLRVPDEDFDLAASAWSATSQAEIDLISEAGRVATPVQ